MTISDEITKLNTNLTNSYTACQNKGATLPADQNFDNLATCIGTITELKGETRTEELTSYKGNTFTPTSGKNGITSITVTPKNRAITLTPSTSQQEKGLVSSYLNGYSGYGKITVNAVTSAIDSNITAGNIKSGVTILGVTGTYEGSGGGGGGDIAIPHIKIIRATSWEVVDNDSGIDFNNIVTDNADNLPYLMFSPEDPDYPDEDWVLTGGFFMSAMRNAFATNERFCPGISVGSFGSQTWYGITFGAYSSDYLENGYGTIDYWYGNVQTNTIQINVTWDVPS